MKLKELYNLSPAQWVRKHFANTSHHYDKPRSNHVELNMDTKNLHLYNIFRGNCLGKNTSSAGSSLGGRTCFPGTGIKSLNEMPTIGAHFADHLSTDQLYDVNSPENDDIYGGSRRSTVQIQRWDVFREVPVEENHGGNEKCYEVLVKIVKFIAYILTFLLVLVGAVLSKGILLFMTSQIRVGRATPYCKVPNAFPEKRYVTALDAAEQSEWIWALFFTFTMPELFALLRSLRIITFKSFKKSAKADFFFVFLFETLHTVGIALLVFVVLPELDAVKGAMLTNCVCFVPAILALLSRNKQEENRGVKTVIDILAILAQSTGLFVWPIVLSDQLHHGVWAIPASIVLTSFGWWENYVDARSPVGFVKYLGGVKQRLKKSRYFVYVLASMWKILVFFASMVGFVYLTCQKTDGDCIPFLTNFFSMNQRSLIVQTVNATVRPLVGNHLDGSTLALQAQVLSSDLETETVFTSSYAPLLSWKIQYLAAGLCFIVGKFACRICIQGFSYAFPANLTIPVTISLLIAACGMKSSDVCFLKDIIPRYLYWVCPTDDFFTTFISKEQAWIWLLWLLSQTWITLHIWTPKCERLANTEKLFVTPMYSGILIDQSLGLNRRRDEEEEVKTKDLDMESTIDGGDGSPCYESISEHSGITETNDQSGAGAKSVDQITHIYACATMWHETDEEMIAILKSVLRMDEDQSARRNAQKYLQIVDPDYYEYETHIFFDDSFEISDDDWNENVVNRFVKSFVRVLDEAAKKVHQCEIRIKPPMKIPTPFGGRLIWTLPGKTVMYAHLKDKAKIRHRKRWSQVMYMYYLLGHRLMDTDLDTARKEALASNTYLLTLDGDIDFKPSAVQLLVDLMKKNRNLGAACGRIHPVGSGMMQWYQKFEYAIGHWLQKATEHMIGCVLCSPGCFSLFRAKALMDDNVMRRYTTKATEALHYVQYDQGEDRWLCTLLLQRGYRVEYSAASDAYTHCPEGFNEFYNQRRRWVPSTMANILDLLADSSKTVKVNDNISTLYIIYQGMLMVGTILGPGTIFLMLVGAFVAAFKIDNWTSFYSNIVPILVFMIVCFVCKSEHQLLLAQILSTGYALIMMAVLVGISLQMREDGIGSPSFIFFVMLSGSMFIAALLHPQEFHCVIPGLLYYLSIPSMYLLLIIYSLTNLNNVTWGTREIVAKKTKALFIAQVLTCFYALVMMAVIVGVLLQVSDDGWVAPTSFFLIAVALSEVATAVLHPVEMTCLWWGWLYWLLIPSMYLLLMIYSLVNMNNVTWGTREVTTKKTKKELEAEKRREDEEKKKKSHNSNILHFFGMKEEDLEGSFSVSLANLCSFMCCTHPRPKDEQIQLMKIQDTLNSMMKRLDTIERGMEHTIPGLSSRRRSTTSVRSKSVHSDHLGALAEEGSDDESFSNSDSDEMSEGIETPPSRDPLINPLWIEDKDLKGPMSHLSSNEMNFWKDMLDKYLYPIDENKEEKAKISTELKELRNKAVFAFFMFNALFILIVFLLQLHKGNLYINWPIGAKTNISWNDDTKSISIHKEYLHLEPIGFVFVIFFALIVVIQFTAMLFHRFGTLSHILASTDVNCCNRKPEELTSEAFIQRNAVEIARAFQRLRNLDGDEDASEDGSSNDHAVGRRKTIHNLEKSMNRKHRVGTLDVAFRKRFFSFNAEAKQGETPILNDMRKLSMRRETFQVLAQRRNTIMNNDRERMQTLGARNSVQANRPRHRASQPRLHTVFPSNGGHTNDAYHHSSDDDQDVVSRHSSRIDAGSMPQ